MKNYVVRDGMPDDVRQSLAQYEPLVQELLYVRGVQTVEDAYSFLNPVYDIGLYNPFLLKDMDSVCARILSAITQNEKIAIYSDYDADGIPGAVVLHDLSKKIGFENVVNYIPLRNEEGFGLNEKAITDLQSQSVTLLITIDCGITDVDEVAHATRCGIDVIITDHHIPSAILPSAFGIINPKQDGCMYPEKMLCGSGVIFKVVQALIIRGREEGVYTVPEGFEKWLLDMVGLATLSDMVPLVGENRVFAYYGMTVLRKSPRAGLRSLFSLLKINQHSVTEDDIAFMITPRINAASRMGIPHDAFLLLSTKNDSEAQTLAHHLNEKNDERKGVVAHMVKEIKKRMHERGDGISENIKKVIVIGNPEWKPSLLGLVANSFSDEHNRPVFLWGREGGEETETIIKGSCRAGGDTDIVALMERAKDVFLDYGGHKGAGGFSVSHENIHTLEERLNRAYDELYTGEASPVDVLIDRRLTLDDVQWNTYTYIEKFAPFGHTNPKPLFLFEQVRVSSCKLFGKEKNHLEIKFKNSYGKDIVAIAFFSTLDSFGIPLSEGVTLNLIATLEKSTFRNFPELRLRIVDIY